MFNFKFIMAIIRVNHTVNYTVISNNLITDPMLDYRDVGLLVYLLSKPDSWEVSTAHLQGIKSAGRDAIHASLNAIIKAGYATRKPNPRGGWDYEIFEKSNTENPNTENPYTENPNTEKRPQVNTDNKQVLKAKAKAKAKEKSAAATAKRDISPVCLSAHENECYEWAKVEPFWSSKVYSTAAFLKQYNSATGALRGQYENLMQMQQAQKSLAVVTSNTQGSNIVYLNSGINYATQPADSHQRLSQDAAAARFANLKEIIGGV